MGNAECRQNTGRSCSEDDSPALSFDENFPNYNETTINRGTIVSPKPQLKFHSICGTNIILLRDGRVAKRRESFCKGLAFSNRPIGIGEIVCIRLCEVGNNWSGVMRFGVTNVDPASFRDIELPKFACPDLTSKGGYWAKSLAERFSVQGLILHFFINDSGEMHYGVNGVHKGLFLSGINVNSPLWTIVDIYGNSVAVEFVDPAEVHLERRALLPSSPTPLHACCSLTSPTSNPVNSSNTEAMTSSRSTQNLRNVGNSTTSRSTASSTPPTNNNNNNRDARLRFHSIKGNNVVIQNNGTTAVRKHGEYYLGYVFTERPIRIGEKIVILVSMTEDAFSGSLAFGLTSCDPDQVPASRLPADSDELLERPEYWVCIKDVGASPQVGTTLNFKVDCTGRVLFSKNDAPFRVIMHVDVSIPLWAFFDLYGSTRKIQILDLDQPLSPAEYIAMRGHRASSEGAASAHGDSNDTSLYISPTTRLSRPSSAQWNMESLRVALPEPLSITPPTQSAAVSTTTNSASALSENTTSTPSFSAPSYSLHEPRDLTNLRVANTLRRLNQQQADLLAEANSSINLASTAATTTSAISSSTNSPSAYSTPLFSSPYTSTLLGGGNNSTNNSESSSQAVNDFINNYRQIQRERMQNHSRSPVRPINNNQRGNNSNNAAANLFEFPNAPTTTNSGASITVPLLPAPLFSSLNVPSNEQQNLRNRAAEFEAALSSSLSSDHSPNRRSLLEGNRQNSGEGGTTTAVNNNNNDADAAIQLEDGDRNNECTICMTNRVNAVIYRCGHMCMCFPCAKETHRRSGDCPICRTPIIDVIRCYPV